MCAAVSRYQTRRGAVVGLCLLIVMTLATSAMAQQAVHQILQRIGPGQPKGSETAPVTVEEFSDFQCAYCGKFSRETLPRLIDAYVDTGKVRWVFRHYAIFGPGSKAAAEASACAGAQGQFWPYHDRLFAVQGQRAFNRENLLHMAQALQLDVSDFADCLDTGRFRAQIEGETSAAVALGLQGTPGFIINGRTIAGALPFHVFQSVIEAALATAGSSAVPQSGPSAIQPPAK
jgi:protein-disulfide isomerase